MRVAPVSFSYAELAAAVARVRGVPLAQVGSEDLVAFKEGLRENPKDRNIFEYVRCGFSLQICPSDKESVG